MNHKSLRREKILAKRKIQQERRKQRQKENRKNTMTEQHRINYYLLKQLSQSIDDRDLELVKYYQQRTIINKKKEKKKLSQAQRCIQCPHNVGGWCSSKHEWCNIAIKNC